MRITYYEVIVGNIGTVYSGRDIDAATVKYYAYVDLSKSDYGRAAGEAVTLTRNGDILAEHAGTLTPENF